jgi:hypothetical protein
MSILTEKRVDAQFVALLKARGLTSIKLTTLGRYGSVGWPDRLVLLPGGRAVFAELKAPGAKPTALQLRRLNELCDFGFPAWWFDSADDAIAFVDAHHAS